MSSGLHLGVPPDVGVRVLGVDPLRFAGLGLVLEAVGGEEMRRAGLAGGIGEEPVARLARLGLDRRNRLRAARVETVG